MKLSKLDVVLHDNDWFSPFVTGRNPEFYNSLKFTTFAAFNYAEEEMSKTCSRQVALKVEPKGEKVTHWTQVHLCSHRTDDKRPRLGEFRSILETGKMLDVAMQDMQSWGWTVDAVVIQETILSSKHGVLSDCFYILFPDGSELDIHKKSKTVVGTEIGKEVWVSSQAINERKHTIDPTAPTHGGYMWTNFQVRIRRKNEQEFEILDLESNPATVVKMSSQWK